MSIRVRSVSQDDSEATRIKSIVYEARNEPSSVETRSWVTCYRADLDGTPVGAYNVHDFEMARLDGVFRCAGIAAVAVLPECRAQGVGREMMKQAVQEARRNGYVMASLYGFRESYYRSFGYEVCGARYQIRCPGHRLPSGSAALPARAIGVDELHLLDACYRAFAQSRSCMVLRTPDQWQGRMGQNAPLIYAVGDPVRAYAWTGLGGAFWEELRFGEVVWADPEAYEALLSVMAGLSINRSEAVWYEPSDSPFLATRVDQGVQISLERHAMFRAIDVPRLLALLRTNDACELSISVRDPLIPGNFGPWNVRATPAGAQVDHGQTAQIAFTIQTFTQALVGQPSFDDLARQGAIDVLDERALQAARALFPPIPVCLMDFF